MYFYPKTYPSILDNFHFHFCSHLYCRFHRILQFVVIFFLNFFGVLILVALVFFLFLVGTPTLDFIYDFR